MPLVHVIGSMSWRLIEWSFVMGALCWLFIHVWTDQLRPFKRRRAVRNQTPRGVLDGFLDITTRRRRMNCDQRAARIVNGRDPRR